MTKRGPGRPSANTEAVSPSKILSEALAILDAKGLEGLTMRALAARVGINPMTIYHHFVDRDGLTRALADSVYSAVHPPEDGDPRARVAGLIAAYHSEVLKHPALTLAIFSRPSVFPGHARRITSDLNKLLEEAGLSPDRSQLWGHILVDYTHGAALAVALAGEHNLSQSPSPNTGDSFDDGLNELLKAL
ncbi:MAG TPA: TetR/AcrR family transcriptional regulator [Devosia sp.]|jgi:AcrR family transcriptional regulator|uniref:TetR/AcrR family transcriptional regulator n=1 Tax=Devosia sp. TaxID=1871048 RepID=UPI002F92629B